MGGERGEQQQESERFHGVILKGIHVKAATALNMKLVAAFLFIETIIIIILELTIKFS